MERDYTDIDGRLLDYWLAKLEKKYTRMNPKHNVNMVETKQILWCPKFSKS